MKESDTQGGRPDWSFRNSQ